MVHSEIEEMILSESMCSFIFLISHFWMHLRHDSGWTTVFKCGVGMSDWDGSTSQRGTWHSTLVYSMTTGHQLAIIWGSLKCRFKLSKLEIGCLLICGGDFRPHWPYEVASRMSRPCQLIQLHWHQCRLILMYWVFMVCWAIWPEFDSSSLFWPWLRFLYWKGRFVMSLFMPEKLHIIWHWCFI